MCVALLPFIKKKKKRDRPTMVPELLFGAIGRLPLNYKVHIFDGIMKEYTVDDCVCMCK